MRRPCKKCQDTFDAIAQIVTLDLCGDGTGKIECRRCRGEGNLRDGRLCHKCYGSGKEDCPRCDGKGYLD